MSISHRFTSADLEVLPQDNRRYEIIDGDLLVSTQPSLAHQLVCGQVAFPLHAWNRQTNLGQVFLAPGVIFAEDDDVAPDVVWISNERLRRDWEEGAAHLHVAPELIVEVLSPGRTNEQRDREAKLKLYSRRGVDEYWIVDWRDRSVDVFRRQPDGLTLAERVSEHGTLESPLLPGFLLGLDEIFSGLRGSAENQ